MHPVVFDRSFVIEHVGVSNKHQLVNLFCCALGSDGVLKDTRFILVQAERPYVQSVAAHVISTEKGS